MKLGVHVSIAGSIDQSVDRAIEKGCNTFQIFTRNPRGWAYKPLNSEEISAFKFKVEREGIEPVVAHMPYLPNLASPKEDIYSNSKKALKNELKRCESLGIPFLVTHLGSHLGRGREFGIKRVSRAINEALLKTNTDTTILLENTSGSRNSIGSSFENIAEILNELENKSRVGICFDTCHAYAAGYDLKYKAAISRTLNNFDKIIGIDKMKVIHLNDSKSGLGSKIDRHEHIGMGMIGRDGFKAILSNPVIVNLPLILETPINPKRDDLGNLKTVRSLAGSSL